MKKLFIPTALAVLLTTGLVAQEAPKVEEKTAAAPAAASTAAPAAEKAAAPAAASTAAPAAEKAAAPAAASTAAPAAEKAAAPAAEKAAAPAADKAKTADVKADKAHTAAKKEHHAAAHHSKVDRKLANELTDKLNAMTCPFAVPAATTVAPAPAADKAHVAAPAA